MASGITIHTKVTGPFFQYGAAPIQDATRELIKDLVREGEAKVEAQLYPGHGVATGQYKSSVHGAVKSSSHGEIDDGTGRNDIVGKFLEAGRFYGDGKRFKGFRMFSKARQHLRRIARELAGKVYAKAVKRLT